MPGLAGLEANVADNPMEGPKENGVSDCLPTPCFVAKRLAKGKQHVDA
jgi:hypothetical protein